MTNKLNETLAGLKEAIKTLLTNESTKEQIDFIASLTSKVEEAESLHAVEQQELADIKDAYIDQVRHSGSSDKPKEDTPPETEPRSLLDLAKEEIEKGQK